uniref:t-SNARE coiled-coil homology domain-containing protein n=1 Tax=Hemiselmis andersenii TaxID=464988 RepID=A0A6U4N492_HEMAN|mmetsp:Transcript_8646/g.21224  ORF Transcript_8646/g.21224 Transcript_8646/m.21224 type:complete len:120 (+) Transcript_8646:282-641(+)|eukprot:CAMPEP_0114134002 /NCGR_PEP_ID=MMETSP0043_2-20121206/13925_1 /TAXON_ID=464988 /ORGANISM="Hemiselmis andersenii, Strain CCMP644" /LENGTH=119 /DNA_ID=CAMNT_0001227613 /DNA_START=228 /DNA_END=587 /DNA_ORIENTATION=-
MGDLWKRGGTPAGKGAGAAAASADVVEKQNEEILGSLQSKIAAMKNITVQINEEVNEQNRALEQMQSGMGATDNLLTSSVAKMATVFGAHGNTSVVKISGAAVVMFLIVFFVIRLGARG